MEFRALDVINAHLFGLVVIRLKPVKADPGKSGLRWSVRY